MMLHDKKLNLSHYLPGRIFLAIFVFSLIFLGTVNAATISGAITDDFSGAPISGLDMNLYDSDWDYVPINSISDNGTFTFYNVEAGDYYVKANPKYPLHYRPEYYNDSFTREGAITVHVNAEEDLTGIDFALAAGYFIGGKILNIDGDWIDNIDLNVYDSNWNKMDVDSESDELGRYFVGGLPDGQYYVMANPVYAQPFVDQYFDHSNGPNNATLVTVANAEDTVGADFELYRGSYIEGYLTDSVTGNPVPGISMKAYNDTQEKMRIEDTSESDGHYLLGAYRAGDYYVRADPKYPEGYMDQYYPGAWAITTATMVTIEPPKPSTGIDFSLPAGSYIRGSVVADNGGALNDIKMKFYGSDFTLYDLAVCTTKSDGSYLSGALKPDNYYVKAVPIYPQPFVDEFYIDAIEPEDATLVTVSLSEEVTGIDFGLTPGGYLKGTVYERDGGDPINNVDMDMYNPDWEWVDYSDHTSSAGNFLIGALPYGSYYLRADPSLSQGFIPQFFENAFWANDAELIELTETRDVVDLDFNLDDGGKIAGRVLNDIESTPVKNIPLEIYTTEQDLVPVRIVETGSDGTYTLHGIPAGTYYVKAAPDEGAGYDPEFYPESSTFDDAGQVSVSVGTTTSGINFTLTPNAGPTPTPGTDLGVELDLAQPMTYPGDTFYLNARVINASQDLGELPLLVMLDVYGQYFFWPSWRLFDPPTHTEIDYQNVHVITGIQIIPVLPTFIWPNVGGGEVTGLFFYAALLSADMSRLVGEMDIVDFGYGVD